MPDKRLIIVTGPTAVGKTDYCITLARKYDSPVISCDSRQIYRQMKIGTAVPSDEELAAVRHYFIRELDITTPYSAGQYEIDALALVRRLFTEGHDTLVMAGGSSFYVEAIRHGLSTIPDTPPTLRQELSSLLKSNGLQSLADELRRLDPKGWEAVDRQNGQRVLRALEVVRMTGRSFTAFRQYEAKKREFSIKTICLDRPREELYRRIDARVDAMIEEGLIEEVRKLVPYKGLNALHTVGYTEIFDYLDNKIPLEEAIRLIKRNTRHYAKKQLSWWRRAEDIEWLFL